MDERCGAISRGRWSSTIGPNSIFVMAVAVWQVATIQDRGYDTASRQETSIHAEHIQKTAGASMAYQGLRRDSHVLLETPHAHIPLHDLGIFLLISSR